MVAHRGKFVAYYRVSTAKQGFSGLGLEAQQAAVQNYLDGGTWELVGEFTEVESGRKSERCEEAAEHMAADSLVELVEDRPRAEEMLGRTEGLLHVESCL